MLYFSTRVFEPDQRQPAWARVLAEHCGPFELKTQHNFEARMERGRIGDLPCVRVAHNAQSMRRLQKQLDATRQEVFYALLQHSGRSRICQSGHEAEMAPGSVVILDGGRPISLDFCGATVQLCIHIPRQLVERKGANAMRIGERLTGASASLVESLVRSAVVNAPGLDQAHHMALQDALLSVIGAALARDGVAAPASIARLGAPQAAMHVIREYIRQNLGSCSLSPQEIAAAHGMSVRHLHRLFKQGEVSLGDFVRRSRLERCADDLRSASMHRATVTEIAFRWGFSDSGHFSRVFKAEFGETPSDYRARGRVLALA